MSASLESVQVVFLDKISISPEVKAVNLSLALSGVNLTLLHHLVLQQLPLYIHQRQHQSNFQHASALENPGRP